MKCGVKVIIDTLIPKSTVYVAWDADNFGANRILDDILPYVTQEVQKRDCVLRYSMGTFRDKQTQGLGWDKVLDQETWQKRLVYNKYPDPRTLLRQLDTPILYKSKTGMLFEVGTHNHNGWLGATHLKDRVTEFQVEPANVHVFVISNNAKSPPSWDTEQAFIAGYDYHIYQYCWRS